VGRFLVSIYLERRSVVSGIYALASLAWWAHASPGPSAQHRYAEHGNHATVIIAVGA
jgi:hypothetical protein